MNKLLLLVLILGTWFTSGAQNHHGDNWLFGYKCGLDFSTVPPQPIPQSEMVSMEGCASISNKAGELQFYTNGHVVWNSSHQMMEDGDSLWIGSYTLGLGTSSTQGVLILPSLSDTNQYLVFTQNLFPDTGIRVSTVDMTFNAGAGKVVAKNQPVYQGHYFSEKLAACRHANGRDWWLVSLPQSSNEYSVLLYGPQGIILDHIDTLGVISYYLGQMAFSRDGNHLGVVSINGRLQLLNFDRCTGKLTDNSTLTYNPNSFYLNNSYYGVCFSPDESKLYVSAQAGRMVLQFSKNQNNQFFIAPPDTIWYDLSIDTNQGTCQRRFFGQMQIGTDNRIYCNINPVCTGVSSFISYSHNLSVINSPDSSGAACDFQPASVFVGNDPHYTLLGLPNMPNYNLGALVGSGCDTLTSTSLIDYERIMANLYPNPNTGNFTLTVDPDQAGGLSIAVVDLLGRLLVAYDLVQGQAVYNVQAGLPSGSYQCVVYKGAMKKQTIPFVVINE